MFVESSWQGRWGKEIWDEIWENGEFQVASPSQVGKLFESFFKTYYNFFILRIISNKVFYLKILLGQFSYSPEFAFYWTFFYPCMYKEGLSTEWSSKFFFSISIENSHDVQENLNLKWGKIIDSSPLFLVPLLWR